MSNIEKISAYLEEQMSGAERQEFENALTNDVELRREFNLQKDIIEGVKEARRLELKSMLDSVPVGGAGIAGTITFGKIASTIAIVGIVAIGVYYFSQGEKTQQKDPEKESITVKPEKEFTESEKAVDKPANEVKEHNEKPTATANTKSEKNETAEITENEHAEESNKVVEINKPSAAPMFETSETDSLEAPMDDIVEKADGNLSSIDVEIDNTRKKYSFHYKFSKGKMFLYGDFDKGLYEIIEFKAASKKTLFLYYKGKFYPLDKTQARITELQAVKEQSLIDKLKDVADINQE